MPALPPFALGAPLAPAPPLALPPPTVPVPLAPAAFTLPAAPAVFVVLAPLLPALDDAPALASPPLELPQAGTQIEASEANRTRVRVRMGNSSVKR
jgi:hypothetical protein